MSETSEDVFELVRPSWTQPPLWPPFHLSARITLSVDRESDRVTFGALVSDEFSDDPVAHWATVGVRADRRLDLWAAGYREVVQVIEGMR